MNKRSIIIISFLVVIALIGAAVVLFYKPQNRIDQDSSLNSGDEKTSETVDSMKSDMVPESHDAGGTGEGVAAGDSVRVEKSEEIKVSFNSPEYDLKVYLCKNSKEEEYIKVEYYNEGVGTIKELGIGQIPELEGIFEKRLENPDKEKGFRVSGAYLNAMYSKVYFIIEGRTGFDIVETSLYSLDLKNSSIKRLFINNGRYSGLFISRSGKYLGYSYYDDPSSNIFQESTLLEILRCDTDEYLVKGSRDLKGNPIGNEKDSKYVYDYSFLSWNSDTAVRLKEVKWLKKDDSSSAGSSENTKDVLYDVERNLFINPDGSAASGLDAPLRQETIQESDPVKTLKSFYSYLSSEKDYSKALNLLDAEFKLELSILKQFGVEAVTKSDIDLDSASMYAGLLKMAGLESIVKEETQVGSSTVYYYQLFSLNEGSQIRQPMTAKLRKVDGEWKIVGVKEMTGSEEPFKN